MRATPNYQNNGCWYDAAVVDTEDPQGIKQLGYVRIYAIILVGSQEYLFVRWYTSIVAGIQEVSTADAAAGRFVEIEICMLTIVYTGANIWENLHIRNLVALAWNPRNQSCLFCYDLLPVSCLFKSAWVLQSPRNANVHWHIS